MLLFQIPTIGNLTGLVVDLPLKNLVPICKFPSANGFESVSHLIVSESVDGHEDATTRLAAQCA
jgi:hypothetical protein